MNFDFITSIWQGAQRDPASMPPQLLPVDASDLPQSLPQPSTDRCARVSGKSASKSPQKRKTSASGHGNLVLALMHARRWVTVTELAGLMGCSVGESSKRIKAAGRLVRTKREGRFKLVRITTMSMSEWTRLAAEAETCVSA